MTAEGFIYSVGLAKRVERIRVNRDADLRYLEFNLNEWTKEETRERIQRALKEEIELLEEIDRWIA